MSWQVLGKPYKEALELQELIMRAARNPKSSPTERAALARAWQVLQDEKRELRGKPKLKPIDSTTSRKSPKPIPPPTLEP